MHPSAAELFAETIEKTGRWIDDLMTAMGTSDPRRAYSVLRAVLHALMLGMAAHSHTIGGGRLLSAAANSPA